MTQLTNVEEKQKTAIQIRDLVNKINELLELTPSGLKIQFIQNNNFLGMSKNSHLCVFISEEIVYT